MMQIQNESIELLNIDGQHNGYAASPQPDLYRVIYGSFFPIIWAANV